MSLTRFCTYTFKYPETRKSNVFARKYYVQDKIGTGHFAKIYRCVHRASGIPYAVKCYGPSFCSDSKGRRNFSARELNVLAGTRHKSIIGLEDSFEDDSGICLVYELAPRGSLFDWLSERRKLTELEARKMFKQLCEGLQYLVSGLSLEDRR